MTLAPAQLMGAASLSDNTQAVLLLTSPLLASGGEAPARAKVLTAREYGQLAQSLLQARHQPADLLNGSREAVLAAASTDLDPDRLNLLLSRGFQLGQALEHWANRSIHVIGRADGVYPNRYKQRLKQQAPPLLYACGNLELLHRPALAVVGSRNTPESLLQETAQIGALAAAANVVITSGAAKGVDEAAMLGAVQAGGSAIGVVADSLEKMAAKPIWRKALINGRLLLLSAEAPNARFQVWRAMARNKLIYALADAALVMSSAKGSGGTWDGATEQLSRLKYCPLHVVDDPRGGEGLPALHAIGASLWPYPKTPEQLQASLTATSYRGSSASDSVESNPTQVHEVVQESLLSPSITLIPDAEQQKNTEETSVPEAKDKKPESPTVESPAPNPAENEAVTPAARLKGIALSSLLNILDEEKTEDELAEYLQVTKPQIKQWCKEMISQGLIRKLNKPVRYVKKLNRG